MAGVASRLFGTPDVGRLAARGKVQALVEVMTSSGRHPSELRVDAVEALSGLADPAVAPALDDESGDVRAAAMDALERRGDPRVVAALTPLLADPDDSMRRRTAEALGRIGDPSAVEPLVAALSASGGLRGVDELVGALVRLGDERAAGPVVEATAEVGRSGVDAVAADLADVLGRAPSLDEAATLWDLARVRHPTRPGGEAVLRAVAEDDRADDIARLTALRVMGSLPHGRGAALVAELLRSPNEGCRASAAHVLAEHAWEPDADLDRAAWWLANTEKGRLAGLDPRSTEPVLLAAIDWPADQLDWLSARPRRRPAPRDGCRHRRHDSGRGEAATVELAARSSSVTRPDCWTLTEPSEPSGPSES